MSRSPASTPVTPADEKAAIAMLEHAFRHVGVRALKDVQLGDIAQHFADYRASSSTPPSDAGSTTRSGGEGVTQADVTFANHVIAKFRQISKTEWYADAHAGHWLAKDIARQRHESTPSPDASPDSGED